MDMRPTSSLWFAISMGLVGVIVGYGLAAGLNLTPAGTSTPPTAQQPTPTAPDEPAVVTVQPVSETDHVRGAKNAKITLIEYADFECPFCSRHAPTMKQILETYPNDVNMVFRHFPLSFHADAQKASEAAECAAKQGGDDAFWAMSDLLFEQGVGEEKYAGYAEKLKLNATKFKNCLSSGETASIIKADFDSGQEAGVRGTPATIIYNNETKEAKLISGALPFASFKTSLDAILK
ncbi:MAG: DsbA family protein [Candidatus Peregrinibacteria bacterium]